MYLPNPLDDFQSYSVHYVLLACRTTVAASVFADDGHAVDTLLAINDAKYLGSPITIGDSTNDVFLVMDTRRFGQFTVESLKYDVYVNGLHKGASTSNLATDLSMVVLDSVGISFANFMQWLMDDQMKANFDGIIFMLRTVFVGHKPDGTSETVQTETIPMHLFRMEINLDYAKGAYTLEFMPNMNFDTKTFSRFMTVETATTMSTGKGKNTLGGLIQSFEDELNTKSLKYYNKVQETIASTGGKLGVSGVGRLVQYMITLPQTWESYEVLGSNIGNALETKFKSKSASETKVKTDKAESAEEAKAKADNRPQGTPAQAIDSNTSVQPGMGITEALDVVFKQVPDIAKAGNFKTSESGAGEIKFFKYIVGITSDDHVMVVHIDVVDFKVPDLFTAADKASNAQTVADKENEYYHVNKETGERIPKDFIEYDFIFTGKNKDIMNFEMKIQEFQMLLASNLRIGDGAMSSASAGIEDAEKVNAENIEVPSGDNTGGLLYARQYDPLVLPLNSASALRNFSNYALGFTKTEKGKEVVSQSQKYTKNLSVFYAGSPVTVALTIKGNPLIMHKFNMGTFLKHDKTEKPTTSTSLPVSGNPSKKAYREDLEDRILKANPKSLSKNSDGTFSPVFTGLSDKSYAVSPVYAKINVMGPNVDFKTNEPLENTGDPYATSVLSNNFYVVFKVTNNFAGSIFTQDLELYSHSVFGPKSGKGAK